MRLLFAVLAIMLIPLTLFSAITATYVPVSQLIFDESTSPLPANRLVAHLGTVTINVGSGDKLFSPSLVTVGMGYEFSFTGPYKTNGQYQNTATQFGLYAVSTRGSTIAQHLNNSNNAHPFRAGEKGRWHVTTFVAEIYLVSDNNVNNYQLHSNYYLTGGTLGNFQIGMSSSGGHEYDPNASENPDPLFPINKGPGDTDTSPVPILIPGTDPEDPISYGDPPELPTAVLTIKEERAIVLSEAVGALTTKVAEAEIEMLHAQTGQQYAVDVVFTNFANTNPFRLVLQNGGDNPHTIEYALQFNGTNVTPGEAVRWGGLTTGPQSENILVTGVSASEAEQALAGNYQDTIVVTIIPADTI